MKSKRVTFGLLVFYLIALTWIIIFKLQFSLENLPHMRNINSPLTFVNHIHVAGRNDTGREGDNRNANHRR